jgi:hypothetical protein
MPNWCSNVVNMTHPDLAMLTRAADAFNREGLFQEFIPCPAELLTTEAVHYPNNDPRKTAHDLLEEQGFSIEAFYYEPGMAFCGLWADGADYEYSIPSTSAEAEAVPRARDDVFDIVNSMAMCGEESANDED